MSRVFYEQEACVCGRKNLRQVYIQQDQSASRYIIGVFVDDGRKEALKVKKLQDYQQ